MTRLLLFALFIVPAATWAQMENFTIQGKIGAENAPARAYLIYRVDGKQVTDSTMLINGVFRFTGAVAEPVSAQFVIDHQGAGLAKPGARPDVKVIYLEKGSISVTGDSAKSARVTGSKLNDDLVRYLAALKGPETEMSAADAQYGVASANKNKPLMDSLVAVYNKAGEKRSAALLQFIRENPNSYLSLLVLMERAGHDIDPTTIEPLYKSLAPQVVQTKTGQNFRKSIDIALTTVVGAMAPVFTQNDVNDKPVSLTEFRGKYVLLDFWASWCGPCRRENPNVVTVYDQYKNKNFTVLGVSLDAPGKKSDWVAAIKTDSLVWTQVSDLKYGDNAVAKLYGVNSIPKNFLIDPSGKIIAKNLRGDELVKKMAEIFNN